ncbi:cytochrome P450 [Mycena belliarum]|uniref:Cytochrome P450 n=1 Tax=Mycena belliarum TaxID=1033014 RepID=A0AAD6U6C3_9AGAR|nr:cytochrome P450 [Mycena belliae]
MSESLNYLYGLGGGTLLFALYSYWSKPSRTLPLPPGPRKLPIVGNLFDMPPTFEWLTYMEWAKKYNSDVLHLNVAGTSIIILSSAEAANELLEKRAGLYSDRARLPMVNELMGWDFALAFMKYGDHWRAHRKLFHEVFNSVAAQSFRTKERAVCHELLYDMLQSGSGEDVLGHLRHMAAKIVMSVAYGIDVLPANDPYVELAEHAVDGLVTAVVPGRFLVDSIPLLKYVPAWFPGAGFQRRASEWRKLSRGMLEKPFAEARRKIASGTASHSFTMDGLRMAEGAENKVYQEQIVQATAGTMYTAGTGTTVSALGTFILALLSNPEAQKKAQAEIDSVIGPDRLPDFSDEPNLPYVVALMKESLRWRNVTPIAIPHFLPVDDEYRGYHLPGGSIVIPNAWAILHDEVMYPEPYSFKPERYLLKGKLNPAVTDPDMVFGFGRRICPGRHMARERVFITLVSILATFNITKAVGDDGEVIEPSYDYFAGLVVMPLPFKCSIKPRSEKAVELIKTALKK